MLSVEPIFWIPPNRREEAAAVRKRFYSNDSDHILLLNLMNAYIDVGRDPGWCADNFVNAFSMNTALVRIPHLTSEDPFSIKLICAVSLITRKLRNSLFKCAII